MNIRLISKETNNPNRYQFSTKLTKIKKFTNSSQYNHKSLKELVRNLKISMIKKLIKISKYN